jgi:hypothetical protein
MIFEQNTKPSLEEALEHFGIKGMRWGVRRDPRNVASRARDRESAAKARGKQNAEIDAARLRVNSGKTRQDLKTAKKTFKSDKKTLGRREARKRLNAARIKAHTDVEKAQMVKSGAETAVAILGIVGGTVLAVALRK